MTHTLQEGALFAGRYRVVRLIASGGMGAVYEVVHLETQRRRALKVMLPHVLRNDELRGRFQREARVAAEVESEFIVDVFDAGVEEATQMPFLVMELLRGEELGKRLKRVGRLTPGEALAYLYQTALALDKTHRAGVVHRDLKPENIFLMEREDGPPRVKVLDFGVAKLVAEGAATGGATEVVGTPTYMAPEQFRAGTRITPAVDVYALGLMAYTLLVGAPYWQEETLSGNAFAIALVAVRGPVEPASVRAARQGVVLPPGFDEWFSVVTAVDPSHRYAMATAAIRALGEVFKVHMATGVYDAARVPTDPTQGAAVQSVGPPTYSATVREPKAPLRPLLLAAAMVALGGAMALAFGVWWWQHGSAPADDAHPAASAATSATPAPPPASSSASPPAADRLGSASAGAPESSAAAPPSTASASASADAPRPEPSASASAASRAQGPRHGAPKGPQKPGPTPVYSQE
jgi:serine/threonine-protein kinase